MKKFLCLLCVLLLSLGLFSACEEPGEIPATTDSSSNSDASDLPGVPELSDVRIPDPALPEDQWILPPVRRGEGTAKVQRLRNTLAELGAEADLAAIVQIGNWRSEQKDAGTLGETDYDAVVLKDYKTDFTGAVVIRQEGCSAMTASDSPLLTYGNTLLLFLQRIDGTEGTYRILNPGREAAVVALAPGEVYVLDGGLFSGEITGLISLGTDETLSAAVQAALTENDPFLYKEAPAPVLFFKETDVAALLKQKLK